VARSFRETPTRIGAEPSLGNGDVDDSSAAAVEFKPKTEPDSPPSHHQPACGVPVCAAAGSGQAGSLSSEAGEPRHVTSSHLLANHQPAPPHHYQHAQMSSPHHLHHHHHHHTQQQQQQQHGYAMPASCSMGFDAVAAVGFAAAAAAQCAGRSFTPASAFNFSPAAHRLTGSSYYDAVRPAGFDGM